MTHLRLVRPSDTRASEFLAVCQRLTGPTPLAQRTPPVEMMQAYLRAQGWKWWPIGDKPEDGVWTRTDGERDELPQVCFPPWGSEAGALADIAEIEGRTVDEVADDVFALEVGVSQESQDKSRSETVSPITYRGLNALREAYRHAMLEAAGEHVATVTGGECELVLTLPSGELPDSLFDGVFDAAESDDDGAENA